MRIKREENVESDSKKDTATAMEGEGGIKGEGRGGFTSLRH